MKNKYKVQRILAEASGECTFDLIEDIVPNPQSEIVTSTEFVVQSTLITAFLTNSSFVPKTYPWSIIVKRVEAFERGKFKYFYPREYSVNRLATQISAGGKDHLEVFLLKKGAANDKTYNVFLPLFQFLFQAVFIVNGAANLNSKYKYNIDVKIDGENIINIEMGEKQQTKKGKT